VPIANFALLEPPLSGIAERRIKECHCKRVQTERKRIKWLSGAHANCLDISLLQGPQSEESDLLRFPW
jgi:hypothetical protein